MRRLTITWPRAARRHWARWRKATAGVAAVEFALVLPLLLTLYIGLADVTPAWHVDRKLTNLVRSLADLSTRVDSVTTSDMADYFAAASAIMRPYSPSSTQMVVTSVLVTQSGNTYTGAVDWSCGKNLASKPSNQTQAQFDADNLSVRPKNSSYPVPAGFQTSGTKSFMLVEALTPHTPLFGKYIVGTIRLRESTTWPVRNNDKVTGPASCPT